MTTVATAYPGRYATGRRSVGLLAAALFAFWPVWVGLVAGDKLTDGLLAAAFLPLDAFRHGLRRAVPYAQRRVVARSGRGGAAPRD